MRVTQKQVKDYIKHWLQIGTVEQIQNETIKILKDLSKFPQENKHQIRFYFKVLELLITKYE